MVESTLPLEWAQTLQAVVEVMQLAVSERAQAAEEVHGSVRRAELLDRNVEEVGYCAGSSCSVYLIDMQSVCNSC